MLKEAIEAIAALQKRAGEQAKPVVLHEDLLGKTLLFWNGEKTVEKYVAKERKRGVVRLFDVESFIRYAVTLEHPAIFVSKEWLQVTSHWGQHEQGLDVGSLKMVHSPEYRALCCLGSSVPQKQFWTMLATVLFGHIDRGLATAISQIKVKATADTNSSLNEIGITTGKDGSESLVDQFLDTQGKGVHTADIPVEWVWHGRIWEAYDVEFEISCRLIVEFVDGQPKFRLVQIKEETVIGDSIVSITKLIQYSVDNKIPVYVGTPE